MFPRPPSIVALLAAVLGAGCGARTTLPPAGHVQVEQLPVLDFGATVDLVRAAGRPAIVALWATWCAPCQEEMPVLSDLQRRYGERLLVLGLATDDPRAVRSELQAVYDQRRPAYPQALLVPGGESKFLTAAGGEWDGMLPKAVAFDATGRPARIEDGVLTATTATALATSLAGPPPATPELEPERAPRPQSRGSEGLTR